jgi:hypothetical protein
MSQQVYNIRNASWMTFSDLNTTSYLVSDHASFPHYSTNQAYFCGGYEVDYTVSDSCFAIDTNASLLTMNDPNQTLTIIPRGSLNFRRGDITAVTDDANEFAILTGGFSDLNNWCAPYPDTELYDFSTNTWTNTSQMNVPRGDNVLVEMNDHIYSIGGERELPNICELQATNNTPGPEQQRLSVNDIEYYHVSSSDGTGLWNNLLDLPQYRFRFAAVSYADSLDTDGDKIYAFGGQLGYNSTCNCFPVTDAITVYTERYGKTTSNSSDDSPTPASAPTPSFGTPVAPPSTSNTGGILVKDHWIYVATLLVSCVVGSGLI